MCTTPQIALPDCSPRLLSQGALQLLDSSSLSPDCSLRLLSQGGLQIIDSSSQVPGPRGPRGPPRNRLDTGGRIKASKSAHLPIEISI